MIRFFSAFLFAIVLLCASFAGFWYYAHQYTYKQLHTLVQQQLGATLTYDQVRPMMKFTGVYFTLDGVKLVRESVQGTVTYTVRQLDIETDFFGAYKFQIQLPHEQRIALSSANGVVEHYTIYMQEGEFTLFPEEERGVVSYVSVKVNDDKQEVLRTGIGDINIKTTGKKLWFDVLFRDIRSHWLRDRDGFESDSLLLSGELTNAPKLGEHIILPLINAREHAAYKQWQSDMLEGAKARQSVLSLDDFVWRKGKTSMALQAAVRLDLRQRLWGDIKFTASALPLFPMVMERLSVLGERDLSKNTAMKQVQNTQRSAPYSYDIRINRGTVLINGNRMGIAPTMAEMMGLETRPVDTLEGDYGTAPAGL